MSDFIVDRDRGKPAPDNFWEFRSGDTFVRVAMPFSSAHGR